MQRLLWIFSFTLGAPVALITALLLLIKINSPIPPTSFPIPQVLSANTQIYRPNPYPIPIVSMTINSTDARPLIIQKYLSRHKSSLEPFSNLIVEISDKYSLDYRLLVAIARQESNLCKRIPPNSHNCWGFGIYGDKVTRFDSYPQALEAVAKTLKKSYIDKGLDTPEKIMAKYAPPSKDIGGPWAKGVNQFLSELE